MTKFAQNKIPNIFCQKKFFEFSLLVGSPTTSYLSIAWFSTMYFESHLASLLITGSLGILQGNLNWDLPLTKVAQNKILNIFRQRKSFELSLLVGSPTISFLSLTWFSKISLEAGHLSRCWNRGENMKILWNNNGVYQNVEDWPMPSDANIIYLYTLALINVLLLGKKILARYN